MHRGSASENSGIWRGERLGTADAADAAAAAPPLPIVLQLFPDSDIVTAWYWNITGAFGTGIKLVYFCDVCINDHSMT